MKTLLMFLISTPLMAANFVCTSTGTGSWSTAGTWASCNSTYPNNGGGNVYFADIGAGHVITGDVTVSVGDQATATPGIRIRGSVSGPSRGTLNVNSGVTITASGSSFTANANVAIQVDQYGLFQPGPGSTIALAPLTDLSTGILCNGGCKIIGTSGSHAVVTTQVSNVNWGTAGTGIQTGGASTSATTVNGVSRNPTWFDKNNHIIFMFLTDPWVANSGGTAQGSFADSSVVFTGATEVQYYSQLTSTGKCWVKYDLGGVYCYSTSSTIPFSAVSYKHLAFSIGAGIQSYNNASYSEFVVQYADLNYLGTSVSNESSPTSTAVYLDQRKSTGAGGTNQYALMSYVNWNYCKRPLSLQRLTGSAGDPIILERMNFGTTTTGGAYWGAVSLGQFVANAYVTFRYNSGSVFRVPSGSAGQSAYLFSSYFDSPNTNLNLHHNVFNTSAVYRGQGGVQLFDGLIVDHFLAMGYGTYDMNNLYGMSLTATTGAASITNNAFLNVYRNFLFPGTTYTGNYIHATQHHPLSQGGAGEPASRMTVANNIFDGSYDCTYLEWNYQSTNTWQDGAIAQNNDFLQHSSASAASVGFNACAGLDIVSNSLFSHLIFRSNALTGNTTGIKRAADGNSLITKFGFDVADYNLFQGNSANYSNYTQFATFLKGGTEYNTNGARTLAGVTLHNPSYGSPPAAKTLAATYTSATDFTLAWDGGTGIQLVLDNGTATAGTTTTLTDGGKAWPICTNGSSTGCANAAVPTGAFLRITGGTGSGQIARVTQNTATVLTLLPAITAPDATSTYVLYKSEVTMTAGGSPAGTIQAAIDYRSPFAFATGSDTGITFVQNTLTYDPRYADSTRSLGSWNAALGGLNDDMEGVLRLQASPEMMDGFMEYIFRGRTPTNPASYKVDWSAAHSPGAVDYDIRPALAAWGARQ